MGGGLVGKLDSGIVGVGLLFTLNTDPRLGRRCEPHKGRTFLTILVDVHLGESFALAVDESVLAVECWAF